MPKVVEVLFYKLDKITIWTIAEQEKPQGIIAYAPSFGDNKLIVKVTVPRNSPYDANVKRRATWR